MKRILLLSLIVALAGCVQASQTADTHRVPQRELLSQLQTNMAKAHVEIDGRKIDIVVVWMTHADARTRSRRLDISLTDNKLGAYVAPIQNLTPLAGPSLQDVCAAFSRQIQAYLDKSRIAETRIQTGAGTEDYLKEDAEQAPRHVR